ncbi:MAG: hypothetical protein KIC54_00870 [Clostridium sp.]|nr:hypothetical protein [Clostridium sp.]
MLGNIVTNPALLENADRIYYRECYCGLCKALQNEHKNVSRFTLNYDMTFLIILLNEVYKEKYTKSECRCMMHPVNKHTYIKGRFVDYVSDMNILLSYYNMIDDWKDDKNILACSYSKLIKKSFKKVCNKYPKKAEIIKASLEELGDIEAKNILSPDAPANCSGKLFGEVFTPYEDEFSEKLRNFGDALGRFIYILDACIDLEKDIKHKKYNPLITYSKAEFDDMLNLLLADCVEKYKELNISNKIIENILYSGIWTKYEIHKKKGEK